ncbi:MAG: putative transposable element tc3 transposase [Streblomastix strix]|uniref:Putative transposable element tc3 transposase n=1 Tax=Streblomastix strix TaxID=222440 RepID=A0A5J4VGT6_9EUKA|nr:MAG: putative transposable element tc3 transposase [Streblomastix strix]
MVCAGVSVNGIVVLVPQLEKLGGVHRYYYLQDGASVQYAHITRDHLDSIFQRRWIGRGGPMNWPLRSPDLTTLDFWIWGYLRDLVYIIKPQTKEQLHEAIAQKIKLVPADMCKRACEGVKRRWELCIQAISGHFEK